MSRNRNDFVARAVNVLGNRFSVEGIDVRLYNAFSDMYNKMFVTGKLICTETDSLGIFDDRPYYLRPI